MGLWLGPDGGDGPGLASMSPHDSREDPRPAGVGMTVLLTVDEAEAQICGRVR